jgi:hypothetical protein
MEELQNQIAYLNEQLALSDQDVAGLQGVVKGLEADLAAQRDASESFVKEVFSSPFYADLMFIYLSLVALSLVAMEPF